jgi:DNA-binding transcriptional LysR family regulator
MSHRNIDNLDLNLIRPLSALLECGSVSQAALTLGMTQPGMSRALARLRRHIQDPLLVRVGGAMQLTEQAQALRPTVRDSLRQLNDLFAVRDVFDPKTLERTYYLGTPDYGEALIVAPLLERVRQIAPRVNLRIVPLTDISRGRLAEGELDCILSVPRDEDASLKVRRLFRERFCCIVRADHPRVGKRLDLDLFCELDHALLMVTSDGQVSGPVDERLAGLGRARRIALTVNGFLGVASIVAKTDLIATVPRRIAKLSAQSLSLRLLPLPLDLEGFDLCLLWHPRRHADADHSWLRSEIARAARTIETPDLTQS